jgi:hypothetical protein
MEMDSKEGNWAMREDNLVGKMIHVLRRIQFELYKNAKEWK